MGCKLYIDKYATTNEGRDALYTIHDNIETRLDDSGLFSRVKNDLRLPRKDSISNIQAKEYVNEVNTEFRTKVVGIREEAGHEIAFVNVRNLAPQVEADLVREQINDVPVGKTEIAHEALQTLNRLSAKFNMHWQLDPKQDTVGRFEDGIVYINPNKMTKDTPFHEFAHPFEQAIKQHNPALWSSLAARAESFTYNGKNLRDFVEQTYPDLTEEDITSETIVTAIGLAATNPSGFKEKVEAKSFLQSIFDFLSSLLGVGKLSERTTIGELAEMMRSSKAIDLSGTKFTKGEQRKSIKNEAENLKKLEALPNIEVTPDEQNYTDGTTLYDRLTNWVTDAFASKAKKDFRKTSDPARHRAMKYYETRGASAKDKIIWEETGKEVDLDTLTELMRSQLNMETKQGTLIHALIENIITPNKKAAQTVQDMYDTYGFESWKFDWISKEYITNLLKYRLHLNVGERAKDSPDEDIVKSEVKVFSKIMNIGTTIDLLVNHSNGALSIFDFKTGAGLLKDAGNPHLMQYGDLVNELVKDTRLNTAKMELMLRAVIIKEQIPEARFRDLAVIHMNNGRKTDIHGVSMDNYLQMIEKYMEANNKVAYEEMKSRGLFDINQYTAASKSLEESIDSVLYKDKSPTEQADMLAREIEQLTNKYDFLQEKIPSDVQRIIDKKAEAILELRGLSKSEALSDTKDMSWLKKHLGTLYDVANPIVQKFLQYARDKDNQKAVAYAKIKNEQRKYLDPLLKEYNYNTVGNKFGVQGLVYHTDDGKGLFDFMWQRKTVGELEGWYRKVLTEQDLKNGDCTKAQLEYSQWFDKTMKELYGTLDEVAYGKYTKAKLLGVGKYSSDFMPRIPMLADEVLERNKSIGKVGLQIFRKELQKFFIEEQYKDLSNNKIGVPVKYMGSKGIISSGNFSFNAEAIMMNFAENMLEKQYSDKVYATGKGVLTLMENNVGNKQKNTMEWLSSYLDGVIANKKEELKLTRDDKFIPLTKIKANFPAIYRSLNTVLTASSMWLSAKAGFFNAVLAFGMNAKEATVGNISELQGIDANYNAKDLAFGMNEWRKSFAKNNFISGPKNESTTKMMRFIEILQFSTNHYKGHINKSDLMTAKNTLLDKSNLYLFHSIGEEMMLYSAMGAMLNHMKVKDGTGQFIKIEGTGDNIKFVPTTEANASTMWEAHHITEDGDFRYVGPSRGFTKEGVQIFGLTSEEITKMQRVTQRVNGSYREHERAMIDNMAMGEWIMKFKKYLPAVWFDNFQSNYEDISMGEYVQMYENGQPKLKDGENVYEWQARVNEGRVNVVMKTLIFTAANFIYKEDPRFAKYRWKNLSATHKQQVYHMMLGTVMALIAFAVRQGLYDDDKDKDDPFYKRLVRLQEDMFQVAPADLIRTVSSPLLQFQYLYKTSGAVWDFFVGGLLHGERISTGPTKGNLPGETYLKHKLPLINVYYGLTEDIEEDRFLGIPVGGILR